MSEEMRSRVAAEIRRELAEEAAAGFPLLRRVPDSETACVPAFFDGLSEEEREAMLDGLAWFATHEWSYPQRQELSEKYPALRRLERLQPVYPKGDWYGLRPKKSKLKKALADRLIGAGFARRKLERPAPERMDFTPPDGAFPGFLLLSLDPGGIHQLDFGLCDCLRSELRALLGPPESWNKIPALNLDYHMIWRACASSGGVSWDLITEANLEETVEVFMETVARLTALATRINALEFAMPEF